MQGTLLRLLDLVQRELAAQDARFELGGRDPEEPRIVWHKLPNGWRIVAIFAAPPADPASVQERLARLSETFSGPTDDGEQLGRGREAMTHRLDDELEVLATRAGAIGAIVIDDKSPVLWGTSEPRRFNSDVEDALNAAHWAAHAERLGVDLVDLLQLEDSSSSPDLQRLPDDERNTLLSYVTRLRQRGARSAPAWRRQLLIARATEKLRRGLASLEPGQARFVLHEPRLGLLARSFANIYWLLLAFDGPFSELQAEGAAIHALPVIEDLVIALPPVDPEPGARVVRLPRPG